MKLFKNLFLILTITTVLISCNTDDDAPHIPTNSEKIIGTWELNGFTTNGTTTTTVGSEDPIEAIITSKGETFTNAMITYNENPKTIEGSGSFLLVTTTKIGQNEEVEQEIAEFDPSGNWKIEDNKLTITDDNDDEVYDIISLTDKILEVKGFSEETITIGSTVVVEKLTANMTFEKK